MDTSSRWQTWNSAAGGLLAVLLAVASGCGGGSSADLNTTELIERYEAQSNRHDPENFVEVDLGKFFVTRRIPDKSDLLLVRFHLYAVTPRDDQANLSAQLAQRNQRMRDTIIAIIQRTKIEDFSEPSMNWVRAELIPAVNQVLKTSAVRDIIFSEFAVERS